MAMSGYLKERMKEEDNDGKKMAAKSRFKEDAVLTHTTTVLAKLHRAILRNWHHILMIVGNLGGNNLGTESKLHEQ